MKKTLLLVAIMFVIGGGLAAQSIPDGGFEFWNTKTWQDPQYYGTSNDQNKQNNVIGVPANVTQTAGKYGNYGVQIATIKYGNDTIGGYMIDANTGGNGLSGGIPYTQKPTGVRFWYKYTTTGVDTAAVLVIFKRLGVQIDSFFIVIPSSASTSTYTLHSYFPSPLPSTPDTVIFGAVSSKAMINQNNNYQTGVIPGSTFVIDSVTFTGVTSQPAELNGNFENWVKDSMVTPPGWYVSYPGVTLTTDHYAGDYALELETTNSSNNGVQQGQASTGYWPNNCSNNCYELGGYPYTLQKDTLEFWYKYAPMPNDTANVSLQFVKNGQSINCCTGISFAHTASVWTYVSLPFDYGTAPDSVIVNMYSSSHNHDTTNSQYAPYVGSILKIDNITFASQKKSLGVNNVSVADELKVYPNPARNQINIDFTNVSGSLEKLAIYDMSGRMLSSKDYSGELRNTIEMLDISSLSTGIYLLEVETNNGNLYQKICKQ